MNRRSLSLALAVTAGFAVGFLAGRSPGWLGAAVSRAPSETRQVARADGDAAASHRLLDEVVGRIRREYVDTVPDGTFDQAAVEGIVARLDPHSAFLDAGEYDEMRVTTAGSYSGVGIEVSAEDGRVVVVTPIDGSPAAKAGVRAGDVILAVDDRPVAADRLEDTIGRMRGALGSYVRLAVRREGQPEPLTFVLERGEVHVRTVRAEPLPGGYGYVRLTQFSDSTPDDLALALGSLSGQGPDPADQPGEPLRGLVLDLRGNPGGVLESAVSVADAFLDEGLIVRANGRTPEARFEMSATPGDALAGEPLVVLVDGGSASGSEIVAGALRDHGRATLMGERTFGKGSVQTVIPLRDGQALKLTTSRYYTPSGVSIHESGIEPDIAIGPSKEPSRDAAHPHAAVEDAAVLTALQYLRDRGLGKHFAAAAAARPASTAQKH